MKNIFYLLGLWVTFVGSIVSLINLYYIEGILLFFLVFLNSIAFIIILNDWVNSKK